ncbi:MAG: hypothetical protein ACHQHM_04310 [Thermoanaerobaculales bacterium]
MKADVEQPVNRPAVVEPPSGVTRRPSRAGTASPVRLLGHVVVLAAAAAIAIVIVVLVPLGGWSYYATPVAVRGLSHLHPLLRPSGVLGLPLGIAGTCLMIVMQLYSLRKRTGLLGRLGSVPHWLEFHIFCGVLGPVLITLHTSLKFNGIVSVAYWSMVLVTLSGFVGRYLYVRIPKTLRGQELTHAEIRARAEELKARLLESALPTNLLTRVDAFEAAVIPAAEAATTWLGLLWGESGLRRRLARLRKEFRRAGVEHELLVQAVALIAERATLLRRIAYLKKTKKLFDMWHVFHRPLAAVMFVIVALHIATALYFGYAFGSR